MIVKVLIDSSIKKLNKVYDYLVKEEDEPKVEIGKRVLVNFGNGKGQSLIGIIVKIEEEKIDIEKKTKTFKLKEVQEIIDESSFIDEKKLSIVKWMSKAYFCNAYSAIKLFLPQTLTKVSCDIEKLKGKQNTIISLNKDIMEIEKDIASKKITSPNHIRLLRNLYEYDFLYVDDINNNLKISKAIIKSVEEKGYIKREKIDVLDEDFENIPKDTIKVPTDEQKIAIDEINKMVNKDSFDSILLHGVTGSGKTEVYLQLIQNCIENGKTAIVLVPEIALTKQIKERFISRFGKNVCVIHSKMTMQEKEAQYKRILKEEVNIVIGPRSAAFVPLKNIGLIVIDEEHDSSYISSTTPKYNTKEVAVRIASLNRAVLLVASATPEITTMYKAKIGKIKYYRLNKRPNKFSLPKVIVVDMKEENLINKDSLISNKLKEEIMKNKEKKEQTFIFLNRRGFSNYIICKTCGHILSCPNCDVSLVHHKKNKLLLCHYCSYTREVDSVCPECGSTDLMYKGMGTEQVENAIKNISKDLTVLRLDTDTTVKRGENFAILDKFKKENIDVLVGTQMISKGHDIENVTLVGVINTDAEFMGNDYMKTERGFQNLLQVAGRAGRDKKMGRVILQAYDTENIVIDCLKNHDYDKFYENEIKYREIGAYPPFVDIFVLELTAVNKKSVEEDAMKFFQILNIKNENYNVYMPKAPYISRIYKKYRLMIIIKAKTNDEFLNILYEKIAKYDKIKSKEVFLNISKNPTYIG